MPSLPKCPLCGAKCYQNMGGYGLPRADRPVVCSTHERNYSKGKAIESGCPYETPDLRAHLAICKKIAAIVAEGGE